MLPSCGKRLILCFESSSQYPSSITVPISHYEQNYWNEINCLEWPSTVVIISWLLSHGCEPTSVLQPLCFDYRRLQDVLFPTQYSTAVRKWQCWRQANSLVNKTQQSTDGSNNSDEVRIYFIRTVFLCSSNQISFLIPLDSLLRMSQTAEEAQPWLDGLPLS